jgi:hypothetical protein
MVWSVIAHTFALLLELVRISRISDHEKDHELLVLRYQLGIADRKLNRTIKPSRVEKLTLAVLTARLKSRTNRTTNQLQHTLRVFSPRTVIRWHNELAKRKCTYAQRNKGGRPRVSKDRETLILRLARENSYWGYGKIAGELLKLGIILSESTIRNVLLRHNIVPMPVRAAAIGWRTLMSHYQSQLLACDFLTVETLFLKTLYVFFFIVIGTRRVYLADVPAHPDGPWVAQQARQYVWELQEREMTFRCLIRDRDSKYTDLFDAIFTSEHINVIRTPVRAPNVNAFAKRWVPTLRSECLDQLLIINEAHLHRVLNDYLAYYNSRRPHQSLNQQPPIPRPQVPPYGHVLKTKVLGGIINDYYRALAAAIA